MSLSLLMPGYAPVTILPGDQATAYRTALVLQDPTAFATRLRVAVDVTLERYFAVLRDTTSTA